MQTTNTLLSQPILVSCPSLLVPQMDDLARDCLLFLNVVLDPVSRNCRAASESGKYQSLSMT
jgi:hypothetical protein